MFENALSKIRRISPTVKKIISFAGVFISTFLVFVVGTAKPESYAEVGANYLTEISNSDIAINNYVSFQLTPQDDDSAKIMPRVYDEYFYWKYIFRHSDFSYLGTVNGGKTHNCYYEEIECDENISFAYCENNFNPEYEGFYKHEVYDIRLMFRGEIGSYEGKYGFFAISQSRANEILKVRNIVPSSSEGYSIDDYKKILGTETTIKMDDQDCKFNISNIYFEDGNFYERTSNFASKH